MSIQWGAYKKSIAALLSSVGAWGMAVSADNVISLQEWFALLVALGGSAAVWGLENDKLKGTK